MHVLQQSNAPTAVTTLLDAAAEIETRLHDAEARAQALQRDLQQLQRRQDHARRWLVTIRKCHRSGSHVSTARAIKEALASLESDSIVLSLF